MVSGSEDEKEEFFFLSRHRPAVDFCFSLSRAKAIASFHPLLVSFSFSLLTSAIDCCVEIAGPDEEREERECCFRCRNVTFLFFFFAALLSGEEERVESTTATGERRKKTRPQKPLSCIEKEKKRKIARSLVSLSLARFSLARSLAFLHASSEEKKQTNGLSTSTSTFLLGLAEENETENRKSPLFLLSFLHASAEVPGVTASDFLARRFPAKPEARDFDEAASAAAKSLRQIERGEGQRAFGVPFAFAFFFSCGCEDHLRLGTAAAFWERGIFSSSSFSSFAFGKRSAILEAILEIKASDFWRRGGFGREVRECALSLERRRRRRRRKNDFSFFSFSVFLSPSAHLKERFGAVGIARDVVEGGHSGRTRGGGESGGSG